MNPQPSSPVQSQPPFPASPQAEGPLDAYLIGGDEGARPVPAVSVLMPAYNAGAFLAPAVESILAQTWRDFELIIIDDGSTDGTRERIEAYAAADRRIRSCPNPRNMGVVKTLNRGLGLARAPWIARMDADDVSYPTRLEKQLALARRMPDAALITSPFDVIEADDSIRPGWRGICFQQELLPYFLLFYNRLNAHGQVMLNARAVREVGGYLVKYHLSEATELWIRLIRHGQFGVVPEPLYAWRSANPNSVTKQNTFRYADFSLLACREEIERACGLALTRDEVVLLRDFWVRYDDPSRDWDAAERLLAAVASRFSPPRPVSGWARRIRVANACGWLSHATLKARRGEWRGSLAHLRRSVRAAGIHWPVAVARFIAETAAVRGNISRRS